jgi:hypothetical protein
VETERIELSSAGCRPAILPLNDVPMVAEVGIEPNLMAAYETAVRPSSSSPHQNWSGKLGSNQRPLDYRSSAQTTLSFSRSYHTQRVEPRARFELAFPDYRSGASPTMLNRASKILEPMERIERSSVAYHATALPLSYIGLEPEGVFETPTSALRMRCSST